MKFVLVLLFALPSLAHASVSLRASNTPLKACLLEQIRSGLRADSVEFVNVVALTQFPAYAEATVIANDANPQDRQTYIVLLKTNDRMGWSTVRVSGELAVTAESVEPAAIVRNSIGKDVITLDLASCPL